jgi:hypothetical protein
MLLWIGTKFKHIKGVGVFPINSSECSTCGYKAQYFEVDEKGNHICYCDTHAKESGKELE